MSNPLTFRKPVTRRVLTLFAAAGLAATGIACGGDDGGGGDGPQAQVAAEFLSEFTGEDANLIDEACVRRITGGLSDSDARAILADREDDVSPDGMVAIFSLIECLDFGDFDLGDLDLDDLLDD